MGHAVGQAPHPSTLTAIARHSTAVIITPIVHHSTHPTHQLVLKPCQDFSTDEDCRQHRCWKLFLSGKETFRHSRSLIFGPSVMDNEIGASLRLQLRQPLFMQISHGRWVRSCAVLFGLRSTVWHMRARRAVCGYDCNRRLP